MAKHNKRPIGTELAEAVRVAWVRFGCQNRCFDAMPVGKAEKK